MKMNIAVVDDNTRELENLSGLIRKFGEDRNLEVNVQSFSRGEELLEDYHPYKYTVVFLDIYMSGMTGIQVADSIRRNDPDTFIVFSTSSSDHMADAFRFHAFDYLEKPATEEKVYMIMDDVCRRTTDVIPTFSFTCDRKKMEIPYSEIVAVAAAIHYVDISDREGNTYRTLMAFSSAREKLEKDGRFLMITRGVLVNMEYIQGFENQVCMLDNGMSFPFTKRKRKQLEQIWQNYIISGLRREAIEKGRRQ